PGKHELFTKAMQGRVDDCLNLLDEIIDDRSRDFLTRLRDVLRTAGDVMSFTNLIREDRGLPGDLLDAVLGEVQDHVLSLIRKMVDEGLELGYIREDLQTESLPYIHLSIIESFIKMESRFGIKAGVKEMLTFIETIVFSGLLSEKGRRAFEEAK
ncbi:MAG: hypothetical protein PQJ50_02145, partial [Spirochaetales bacterium]|nr:hypothetical protein [Spirochaetales bacterium]